MPSDRPSDELAATYDRRAELGYSRPARPNPWLDRKFERVLELIRAELPAERFLDAGCGDGRYQAALAALPERPRELAGSDLVSQALNWPRDLLGRLLRLRGRRQRVRFPHASYSIEQFQRLIAESGLTVERLETFRFSLKAPLDRAFLRRALNWLDRTLPPHRVGDIVAIVAKKERR